jgi:hypothetical protein
MPPIRVPHTEEALDGTLAGMEAGLPQTFARLDELLVTVGASVNRQPG